MSGTGKGALESGNSAGVSTPRELRGGHLRQDVTEVPAHPPAAPSRPEPWSGRGAQRDWQGTPAPDRTLRSRWGPRPRGPVGAAHEVMPSAALCLRQGFQCVRAGLVPGRAHGRCLGHRRGLDPGAHQARARLTLGEPGGLAPRRPCRRIPLTLPGHAHFGHEEDGAELPRQGAGGEWLEKFLEKLTQDTAPGAPSGHDDLPPQTPPPDPEGVGRPFRPGSRWLSPISSLKDRAPGLDKVGGPIPRYGQEGTVRACTPRIPRPSAASRVAPPSASLPPSRWCPPTQPLGAIGTPDAIKQLVSWKCQITCCLVNSF